MGNEVFQKAKGLMEYVMKLRRQIHQNPELGLKEYETAALIKQELESYGVEVVPISAETGVLGILRGEKEGGNTVTAFRADIDALPILEQTGLPYASKNTGVMHACGHDGHTAILLGTAKLLSSMRDRFSGTVKFIFQPGEETLFGAKEMVKAGVLENPDVDIIVALHAWPFIETGKIGIWPGPYQASGDKFSVKIYGGGGHGAYPHKSKDPLLAANHAVIALQSIVSRQINAIDSTVLSVCTFHAGNAFNVIPEEVEFTGTVRCHNKEVRNSMEKRMEKILKGIVEAFDCNYELDYQYGVPMVVNNPEVLDLLAEAATQAIGENSVETLPGPVMGSEDFSLYLEKVPGAFVRLGNTNPGEEEISVHNDRFNFNDDAIPYGMSTLTQFVLNKNI